MFLRRVLLSPSSPLLYPQHDHPPKTKRIVCSRLISCIRGGDGEQLIIQLSSEDDDDNIIMSFSGFRFLKQRLFMVYSFYSFYIIIYIIYGILGKS